MANLLGRFVGLGNPLSLDLCKTPVGRGMVSVLSSLGDGLGVAGDTPEARQLRDAPSVVRSELLFAYLKGMRFILAIRAEFGWAGVDAVLRDLPDSPFFQRVFFGGLP